MRHNREECYPTHSPGVRTPGSSRGQPYRRRVASLALSPGIQRPLDGQGCTRCILPTGKPTWPVLSGGQRRPADERGLNANQINHLVYLRWHDRSPQDVLAWHRQVQKDVWLHYRKTPGKMVQPLASARSGLARRLDGHLAFHRVKDIERALVRKEKGVSAPGPTKWRLHHEMACPLLRCYVYSAIPLGSRAMFFFPLITSRCAVRGRTSFSLNGRWSN